MTTPDQAPHDWCPECDGPGECQPGLCCGRPYPSLAEAEMLARHHAALNPWLTSIVAEFDARGERIAELELRDRVHREQFAGSVAESNRLREDRERLYAELAEAREWIQDRQESDYEKRELG